ncbi:MAG: cobalamin biosynthesis protein [Dehalococcoidia bacterium]|nr:cobalamin biosynthesis protein [Dehalococcoidia bacterium]
MTTSEPQQAAHASGGPRVAVMAITKHSAALSQRLRDLLPGADLFIPDKFASQVSGDRATLFNEKVSEKLGELFTSYDNLVLFISLGAVVRMLAGHLKDKRYDPGVVVVDDRGRFAISVLSGHMGGANALARRVADLLGAQPVITTASDVGGTIAVDLFGRDLGWRMESDAHVTQVSAAVVNEEPVGVLVETGESDWWPAGKPLPASIRVYATLDELAAANPNAALIVTDRLLDESYAALFKKAVVYRPRSLAVGVGCKKGAAADDIERLVRQTLQDAGLSVKSVRNLASIDAKRGEPGLEEVARRLGVPIVYYTAEQLNAVEGVESESKAALAAVGAKGVCEPAALLSAGARRLLVSKRKTTSVTVAVARMEFSKGK